MDDLIPSECCDHKHYPTSQKQFENQCILLKLSVVFQHPRCALSSLNACAETQINLPVSSCRNVFSVSSSLLVVAGSLKAVYRGDKARSSLVAAVSLNFFFNTPVILSTKLCRCFVRVAHRQHMNSVLRTPEDMDRAGRCPCTAGKRGGEIVWREVTSWKKNGTEHPAS